MLSFKSVFPLSSFTFTKRFFNSSLLSGIRVISSLYLRLLVVLPTLVIGISESGFWLVLHPIQHFTCCTLPISLISTVTIYSLMHSFLNLEPLHCSMSNSNCCFLTCIQISQEAGKVVWYTHVFKNFPQFVVIHTVKDFNIVNKAEADVF